MDERVTLPILEDMTGYWKNNPPIHLMIAAYMGVGKKEEEPKGDLSDLMIMFPNQVRDNRG